MEYRPRKQLFIPVQKFKWKKMWGYAHLKMFFASYTNVVQVVTSFLT